MRSPSPRTVGLLVAVALLALPRVAATHSVRLPVAADELRIGFVGPGSPVIEFRFTDQEPILLNHDPRIEDTAVLVYGTGANAGSTGRIDLDQTGWTSVVDPVLGPTFVYTDPAGTSGIASITLSHQNLTVIGDAASWPWNPVGRVDELWFHFLIENEWLCAEADYLTASMLSNATGRIRFQGTTAPSSCPDQVCGNRIREPGEVCDDGNIVEGDGCSNDCQPNACDSVEFGSTYEGIQNVIFDSPVYNCSNALCHGALGAASSGNLNLTAAVSHSQLVDIASSMPSADGATILDRVEPGEPIASFLIEKLSAKTYGTPTGGVPMPNVGPPLTPEHLEAIDKWVRAGAPEHLVVEGTAGLLGTCLPPEDPLKLDPPPPYPPLGEGIQFRSTAWPLPASFEDEICYATYYDFTGTNLVPEEDQVDCPGFGAANNPSGKCFYYDRRILRQDAQSHHSIIHIYNGGSQLGEDGAFGEFTYKPNYPNAPGAPSGPCDPYEIDPATGQHADCSGSMASGVACTGYDPVDAATRAPSFAGSQEPYVDNVYADGVFSLLPMAGVIIWNSHAFNLSVSDSTMAHYLDVYFGHPLNRRFFAQGIFDIDKIFIHSVPPFEAREYCKTHTIGENQPVLENVNLFELTSHTHRWGTRFRIWGPPNDPCWPGPGNGPAGINVLPCDSSSDPECECAPGPQDRLLYFSTQYTDPVQLEFDPPMLLGPSIPDRTFLYCSLYDNGSTPDSPPVKRQSTSPEPPPFGQPGIPFLLDIGGPCPDVDQSYFGLFTKPGVMCMDGPNRGAKCGAALNPAQFCQTSMGANDGVCDACAVMGGVTTEDEMFILIGSYFVPEPGATALAAAALATLAGLAVRRRPSLPVL